MSRGATGRPRAGSAPDGMDADADADADDDGAGADAAEADANADGDDDDGNAAEDVDGRSNAEPRNLT